MTDDLDSAEAPGNLSLAADFAAVDAEDWLGAVEALLKTDDFHDRLMTPRPGGVIVEPLYDRANHGDIDSGRPGAAPWIRGADIDHTPGWDLCQRHDLLDPEATNAAILEDLEQGVTSILLRLHRKVTGDELAATLDGVYLELASIALDAGPWANETAPLLQAQWDLQELGTADRRGAFRIDPLGSMARFGAGMPDQLGAVAAELDSPHVTTMAVDTTVWSDGGASAVTEIAAALGTGVEYLRWLTQAGLSVDDAAGQIEFTFSATADQFETIAKLRAARLTWGRIIGASGGTRGGQRQHAITSPAMFSRRDPWVNLLRATTAGFAAAAGGAQAITILPFDSALGVPSELGRRTARNISLLLQEEAHVGQVTDPGGGSWFVETTTRAIADAGWSLFQRIEASGGMNAWVTGGMMQDLIEEEWNASQALVDTRTAPIVGVSEFPNLAEKPEVREPWPTPGRYNLVPSLVQVPQRRTAGPFESLRDAVDRFEAAKNPADHTEMIADTNVVFVAALGSPAMHSARLGFATNFFAAGGLRAVLDPDHVDGYDEPGDAADAFARSGARIAVICSSDAGYAEGAVEMAGALKNAGCDRVYLAGNPGDSRAQLQRAGVDAFIHIGSNVRGELEQAHALLGLSHPGGMQ